MRRNIFTTSKKGFSLIELCIVMAILAVLTGSITPIFIKRIQIKAGEKTALEMLKKVEPVNAKPKLLLDLHGFSTQPVIGEFDLILGTDHRTSVGDSIVDQQFADFMRARNYRVYLPTQEEVDGERFTASGSKRDGQIVPLVQEVVAANITNAVSMQLEIAWHFRQAGAKEVGTRLANNISEFIVSSVS